MSSVVDNQPVRTENVIVSDVDAALMRWRYSSPSAIFHHGKACCATAREWLFATDHSQLNGDHKLMGPRWLRRKYNWGPSQWPMSWCQAVEQDELDCGALAAVTREVFTARGVLCHSVQLVQQYSEETTNHWSTKWTKHPASTHWIQGALIYHEACAVQISANEIRIWDPSAACWVNPKQAGGYGSVLALRLTTDTDDAGLFSWAHHEIPSGEWHVLRTFFALTRGQTSV
jgi:hypothetical protein